MVRFSDAPCATWIEAATAKNNPVMPKGDVVSFVSSTRGTAILRG